MISKNIFEYLQRCYPSDMKTITELSKRSDSGKSLVCSESKLYDFDKISQGFFDASCCPASIDAIFATMEEVVFVEFKSGFKKTVKKDSLNSEKAKCKEVTSKEYVCTDYWDLFFKNQKNETTILIDSLKLKAVESYFTLEKKVFSNCVELESGRKIPIKYYVVIDEDGIDVMEDTLGALSGVSASENNSFENIRKSLKRYINPKDAEDEQYLYQEIYVLSVKEFLKKVELCTIPTSA